MSKLTDRPRVKRFIQEYCISFNGTDAAIKAGYSKKTAHSIASENLRKPEIKAAIDQFLRESAESAEETKSKIIKEYQRLAFFDISRLYDADGNIKSIHDIDEDTRRAISSIEASEITAGEVKIGTLRKVRTADKRAALDSLAKIKGLVVDKSEHSGPNGSPIQTQSTITVAPADAYKELLKGKL